MIIKALKRSIVAIIALALLSAAAALAAGEAVYTNTRMLADNLEYVNTVSWDQEYGRTESFAVRMTGAGDSYPIVMKGDTVYGSTKITSIINYAESLGKNVLAAVNADFFFTENGIPLGVVVEDGVYKSSPGGRNAVCFGYDGGVRIISPPSVTITFTNHGGAGDGSGGQDADEGNAGKTVSMSNFNKTRTDAGGMCLYSEVFSTVSTRTSASGWFVRFRILEGAPSVSGTMALEVTEAFSASGAVPIGEGFLVLTAADQSGMGAEFEKFAVGDLVTLTTTCSDIWLANAAYATGGGDIIVADGVGADPAEWNPTLVPRAPRTALGLRADGTVVCYVIDGRNSEHSIGMTLVELTDEMLRQGCVYAVNFDGGGSSALSVRLPGEPATAVINKPSDGAERGCATYIIFVTDEVSDKKARNLGLKNDGAIVMAESSVTLSYTATDRGYMPVEVPGDITALAIDPGASVDGAVYTAGSMAGTDRLRLYSQSAGAYGMGEIYVITRPTSITAVKKGSTTPLTAVRLSPGDTLELDVIATYYRRQVVSQLHSFEYVVSGDIGEMLEPGVFQAGQALLQDGAITISAGGRSTEIKVEISGFADMAGHWGREYAEYLLREGISIGVSATEYGPSLLMKRADFILMLYRAAGQTASGDGGTDDGGGTDGSIDGGGSTDGGESFADIPPDAYYAKALAWAKAMGIADSDDSNNFYPQEPLRRQDAFTFTYRALDVLGKKYEDGAPEYLEAFPDAGDIDDYAVIPTATLIKLGVVDGMNGILSPHSTLTRAQMAKVLTVTLQLRIEN